MNSSCSVESDSSIDAPPSYFRWVLCSKWTAQAERWPWISTSSTPVFPGWRPATIRFNCPNPFSLLIYRLSAPTTWGLLWKTIQVWVRKPFAGGCLRLEIRISGLSACKDLIYPSFYLNYYPDKTIRHFLLTLFKVVWVVDGWSACVLLLRSME